MKVRVAVLGVLAAVVLAAPARACPLPVAYPGDGAAKEAIAQWMAHGAMAAGLPGELRRIKAIDATSREGRNRSEGIGSSRGAARCTFR